MSEIADYHDGQMDGRDQVREELQPIIDSLLAVVKVCEDRAQYSECMECSAAAILRKALDELYAKHPHIKAEIEKR